MKPIDGYITTNFYEPRPLSKPLEKRNHNHGAIDLAGSIGDPIIAVEAGEVYAWCAYRIEPSTYWPTMPIVNGYGNQFANYFYDTFGGVIILRSLDGNRTHVITHSYGNQLFNKRIYDSAFYIEQKDDVRFPIHGYFTPLTKVHAGSIIGYVGNAGFSTGAHIHWEIHRGARWNRWEKRINPEHWGE